MILDVRSCIALSGITSRTGQPHRTPEPWLTAREGPGLHRSACADGTWTSGGAPPEPEGLTREVFSIRHAPTRTPRRPASPVQPAPERDDDQRFRWSVAI